MSANFDRAVQIVLAKEGVLSNDANDPGGLTKYGISKTAYPNLDIANLTVDQAIAIYERDYWAKVRGDELPWIFALPLFDSAVNQGVGAAVKFFQAALKVSVDGDFGPATMAAATKAAAGDPTSVLVALMTQRISAYTQLNTWPNFGRGWTSRCFSIALAAATPPPAGTTATA